MLIIDPQRGERMRAAARAARLHDFIVSRAAGPQAQESGGLSRELVEYCLNSSETICWRLRDGVGASGLVLLTSLPCAWDLFLRFPERCCGRVAWRGSN